MEPRPASGAARGLPREVSTTAIASSTSHLWYRIPPQQRASAARRLEGVPVDALGLDAFSRRRLIENGYPELGSVALAAGDIAEGRMIGARTLARIDAAIQPLLVFCDGVPQGAGDSCPQVTLARHGLAAVRDMPDYTACAWYDAPLPPRAGAALALAGASEAELGLTPEALQWLRSASDLTTPAALVRARREDIPDVAGASAARVGPQVHEALRALAADRLGGLLQFESFVDLHRRLAERVDLEALGVQQLPWPPALCLALADQGIETLRQALDLGPLRLLSAGGLGQAAVRRLCRSMEGCLAIPPGAEGVDWAALWTNAGIPVVPSARLTNGPAALRTAAHEAIRDVVLSWLDATDWLVLQARYGLLGAPVRRLQNLGEALGVTRQRVQQREARAVRRLGQLLVDRPCPRDWPNSARMHPEVVKVFERLSEILDRADRHGMHATDLQRLTDGVLGRSGTGLDPIVRLMIAARGLGRVEVGGQSPAQVWVRHDLSDPEQQALEKTIRRIHVLLTEETDRAFTEVELAEELNGRDPNSPPLQVSQVADAARLCSTVERTRFGEIRGRTTSLARRDLVLMRLLHDAGQPMHITALVRELNALYAASGRRSISHVTTGNYLSACQEIVPIGKSGYWALRAWRHVDTGTIVTMMAECLKETGRPMTADEIFARVSRRRPLRQASVASYLTSDPRFVKVDRARYGLVGWPESEAVLNWNKRGLAAFVAAMFRERGVDVLPYRQVADAVVAASGLRPASIRGMLATNPVIATERSGGGLLLARFQSDYEAALALPRRARRRPGTLVTAVTERIRAVLAEQPGRAMPMASLRAQVLADIATTKGTFYSYLGRMPDVEKLPDARGRLQVRLVESGPAL